MKSQGPPKSSCFAPLSEKKVQKGGVKAKAILLIPCEELAQKKNTEDLCFYPQKLIAPQFAEIEEEDALFRRLPLRTS